MTSTPERRLTPLRFRLTTYRRLALTTAMRMVAWVHHRSTHHRPAAHVPVPASLTNHDIFVINIANLAKCGHAVKMNEPNLT